jgi:hypothetical protein
MTTRRVFLWPVSANPLSLRERAGVRDDRKVVTEHFVQSLILTFSRREKELSK